MANTLVSSWFSKFNMRNLQCIRNSTVRIVSKSSRFARLPRLAILDGVILYKAFKLIKEKAIYKGPVL